MSNIVLPFTIFYCIPRKIRMKFLNIYFITFRTPINMISSLIFPFFLVGVSERDDAEEEKDYEVESGDECEAKQETKKTAERSCQHNIIFKHYIENVYYENFKIQSFGI